MFASLMGFIKIQTFLFDTLFEERNTSYVINSVLFSTSSYSQKLLNLTKNAGGLN